MPAQKHTKKADTPKKRRQWQHIRESAEARGYPVGQAIAMASGVLKRQARRGKKRRS
jgi:hypothetical protein